MEFQYTLTVYESKPASVYEDNVCSCKKENNIKILNAKMRIMWGLLKLIVG